MDDRREGRGRAMARCQTALIILAIALAFPVSRCAAAATPDSNGGASRNQKAELIKQLCITAGREDHHYAGQPWTLSDLIVDSSLEFAMNHGIYVQMAPDLAKARAMMRAALAEKRQTMSIAAMCQNAGQPVVSANAVLKQPVRAAVAAASGRP